MSRVWTKEQKKVIDLRGRNILVSAAAGSGKTAVLVERIIQRITDPDSPTDVDRMLVVTYTEAAALEMKERIRAALEKKLEQNLSDERLGQQAALLHSASITTTHSFCMSVIRDHFHVIGIDPGFRVAEEGELKLLKQDVLDELLEQCYEEGDEEFLAFTEKYSAGRNDKKIEEFILNMYEFSRSYPQPEKWLDLCAAAYETQDILSGDFVKNAEARIRARLQDVMGLLQQALKICGEADGPYMYGEMIESDIRETEKLSSAEGFEAMYEAASSVRWKRLSAKKDETVDGDKKIKVKSLRGKAKDLIADIQKTYFYEPWQSWAADMEACRGSVEMLTGLVKKFSEMFSEKKRSRNIIDFSDMEQFALRILTQEKEGGLEASSVAEEYQEQFEEIMVDEYQDSNLVQEAILTSVSRAAKGKNNIFMVGDVKQSIYRFRLSRPELFMEKYDTYTLEDSCCQRVDLHKNFRSRAEVLDSVNYLFFRLMQRRFGGIEYDDNAALYPGADFPEHPAAEEEFPNRTELLLMDKTEADILKKEYGMDSRKAEARMIAGRIKKLMETACIYEREEGKYRKIQYRDIAILTRSVKGWAESITSVLAEEGIPACSVSREGYFETYEVRALLDYLKILDNSRQDIPLAAALTSPFGGLTVKELAKIRLEFPDKPFYEAVVQYAAPENENPDETRKKLKLFYARRDYFRRKVPYTPIHELLDEIIEQTGYGIYISAMPGGAQRLANIEMLSEKAAAFEGTSYKGLFNFIRYIEQLKKYDVDYGEAGMPDERADTVRVMSIHKSKGLEFPVVFAAGLGKRFNLQDTRGSIILHPELGAGFDLVDLKQRTKTPVFLKKMIQEELTRESLTEELRVLYVALTRAKEKLIMTGIAGIPDLTEKKDGPAEIPRTVKKTELFRLESARTYLDWIFPALLCTGEDGTVSVCGDCPIDVHVLTAADLYQEEKAESLAGNLARDTLENWDCSVCHAPGYAEKLRNQMEYVYPWAAERQMKLKFTVSELKKRTALVEEAGEEMFSEPDAVPLVPRFMAEETGLTGASRGSAYHKLLELLDFTERYNEDGLKTAVESYAEEGKLTKEMAQCIRMSDILRFLNSSSGKRMSRAAEKSCLYREQPFVLGIPAAEIYPEDTSCETVLVQGIIDVYFEEPDGLVVLDYKTDQIRAAGDLAEKYHAQLDYYARALEQLTGKKVKEKIIYSFALGEEIRV